MMDQPWYEQSGPTKEDGITALKGGLNMKITLYKPKPMK